VVKVIKLSRSAITVFTLAFGLYHAILGAVNFDHYGNPEFVVLAIALYLAALVISISDSPGLKLKDYKAAFSLVAAMLISLFMAGSVSANHADGHSTWHVAGIATLMAIIALRQHKVMAWTGLVVMILEVLIWGGIDQLFRAGIFGAVMLVAAAHASAITLASTAKAALDFREQALATAAATAAKSAARTERKIRVEKALSDALPFLNKIERLNGQLTEADRAKALELEAMLRDQIRGRNFDLPELLQEISLARSRGVEVQVLDDGGLEQLSEPKRRELLSEVAKHVAKVQSGKLVLRSVADEDWVVTIAASTPGAPAPDLFIRI
jgi:hypothetical protein